MNNIIQSIQGQIQLFGVLLNRRNDVTTTTRRSQRGRLFSLFFVFFVSLWCVSLCLPLTASAEDSVCAEVKIEIKQELTLERQAFEAHMRINNGLSNITLENLAVTVNFLDEEGNPVQATSDPSTNLDTTLIPFFIRLDSTNNVSNLQMETNNLDFSGTVNPSTSADIYWLIIPTLAAADELGGELTSLIREINTYSLVRDVLVNLPGRDTLSDFLATDRDNPGV